MIVVFFENNIVKKAVDEDTISQLFYETKKIVKNIDYAEFYRVMHVKKECINDPVKMIQVVQLYLNEKLDLDGVHKVLHRMECNFGGHGRNIYRIYFKSNR